MHHNKLIKMLSKVIIVYIQVGLGGICMQASCVSCRHHIHHLHGSHLQDALPQGPGFLVLMLLCRINQTTYHSVLSIHMWLSVIRDWEHLEWTKFTITHSKQLNSHHEVRLYIMGWWAHIPQALITLILILCGKHSLVAFFRVSRCHECYTHLSKYSHAIHMWKVVLKENLEDSHINFKTLLFHIEELITQL